MKKTVYLIQTWETNNTDLKNVPCVPLLCLSVYLTAFNCLFEVACPQDMELKWVDNYRSMLLQRPQDWVQAYRACSKIQPSRLCGGSSWNNLREWRLASYPLRCRDHVFFPPLCSFSITIHPFTSTGWENSLWGGEDQWKADDLLTSMQYFHTENKLVIFIKWNIDPSYQKPRINTM